MGYSILANTVGREKSAIDILLDLLLYYGAHIIK